MRRAQILSRLEDVNIPRPENDNDSLEMIEARLRVLRGELRQLDDLRREVEETFEGVRKMIEEG